uniref:BolA-like protein 3 n=2 Tax=Ascaris TaxID=6251 RepID=A0A0M3HSU1_ASCLU
MLRLRLPRLLTANAHRALCSARSQTEGEKRITKLLQKRFPNATTIDVMDVSSGCGSMYQIVVECDDFKGLPKVRQHRMVTDTLKEEIASMHGVVVETSTPK